tara:strand:+ start:5702 stop:5965 length:264 start_codon:yes stop_codon:yes gene_type:complete
MRPENYSSLKSASKVSFSKSADDDGNDIISLTEKRYNSATGEAADDAVNVVRVTDYERDKARLEAEKSKIESQITGLTAIISDINAL